MSSSVRSTLEPRVGSLPSVDWELLSCQARRDARARFGDIPSLEDLVQDALVLLLEKQARIESPRAWVASTVWRLAANRHRSLTPTRWDPSEETTVPAIAADPDLRLDLASAARRLAPVERRLLGSLVLGRSHREIADQLGIGWKSVGVRVQRLRRKLGSVAADATVRP